MGITSSIINSQVLADAVHQSVVNTLTRNSDFYRLLLMSGAVIPATSAKGIQWKPTVTDSDDVIFFAEGDPAPNESQEETVDCLLAWAKMGKTIAISELAELQLGSDLNGEEVENYWVRQLEGLGEKFTEAIDTGLRGGTVTNGFIGQTVACSDTGSYGGQSRTTYSTLQSYILALGGALTESAMRTVHANLVEENGGAYNVIVGAQTTIDGMDGFGGITQTIPVANQQQPFAEMFGVGSGFVRLQEQYRFKNTPVYAIAGWPSGRLDFMNLSSTEGPRLQILRDVGLKPLAKTSDMERFYATMYAQYVIENPKKTAAAITGIT